MLLLELALLSGIVPGTPEGSPLPHHAGPAGDPIGPLVAPSALPPISAPEGLVLVPEDLRLVTEHGIVAVPDGLLPDGPAARLRCEVRLTFPAGAHGLVHEISEQEVGWSLSVGDRTLMQGSAADALILVSAHPARGDGLATLDLPLPARALPTRLEMELLPPRPEPSTAPPTPPLPISSGEDSEWFSKCKNVKVFNNCNDNPSQEICGPCVKQPASLGTCPGEAASTGPGYITEPASCNFGFSTCSRITTVKFAATYTYDSKTQKPCDTVTSGFSFSAFLGPFWQAGGEVRREKKSVSTCCTYVCNDEAPLKPVNVRDCY